MNKQLTLKTRILVAVALVAIGVAGRLLPHAWNFAPIVAIGIFSGAYLGKRFAFLVPVIAMAASDAVIGFYGWKLNLTVYAAMALSGAIGLLLRRRRSPISVAAAALAGSTLFFLVTNGAVWYLGSSYAPGLDGLLAAYVAGLPFYRNAVVGDIWYSWALFGAFEFALWGYRSIIGSKTHAQHSLRG
ncbi:MAG TPA: DUF6580 family putative transport protein [Candidatus Paceibacterota bacterium]|nr:DUF6580 family putative transport protein [Candidatus Paceibacterota bacterium]